MPRYRVYGRVTGSQYLGEFEADSAEDAKEKAEEQACCSLCHQCSEQCEDPEVEAIEAEEIPAQEPVEKKKRRR